MKKASVSSLVDRRLEEQRARIAELEAANADLENKVAALRTFVDGFDKMLAGTALDEPYDSVPYLRIVR